MTIPTRSTRSNVDVPSPERMCDTGVYTKGKQMMYTFGEVAVQLDTSHASDTDTCPIWQERFQDVELEIAKGKPFLKKHPEICVATLPCGHRFSALGIMYHFVLLDMRCPLCRDGVNKRARVGSIPHVFRGCMKYKLKSMREEEKTERDSLDAQTALQMQETGDAEIDEWLSSISSMLSQDNRVDMTVYMFVENPDGVSTRTIHVQNYELMRVQGGMRFSLSSEV
jgi:hypothetical protein